jgi:hypothetical protein
MFLETPLPAAAGVDLRLDDRQSAAELLEGSPFADELIGEHNRLSPRLETADKAIGDVIIAEMEGAGIGDADKIVPVLMAAGSGMLIKFPKAKDVREGMVLLCERVVKP